MMFPVFAHWLSEVDRFLFVFFSLAGLKMFERSHLRKNVEWLLSWNCCCVFHNEIRRCNQHLGVFMLSSQFDCTVQALSGSLKKHLFFSFQPESFRHLTVTKHSSNEITHIFDAFTYSLWIVILKGKRLFKIAFVSHRLASFFDWSKKILRPSSRAWGLSVF